MDVVLLNDIQMMKTECMFIALQGSFNKTCLKRVNKAKRWILSLKILLKSLNVKQL